MQIVKIISQHRRDFKAIYQCEFCKHTEDGHGYDDRNFHDNVVPDMKCEKCGKSTNSENAEIVHTATKYPEGMLI